MQSDVPKEPYKAPAARQDSPGDSVLEGPKPLFMTMDGRTHPFSDEISRVLSGRTQLGARMKPMTDALMGLPEERRRVSVETFRLVYGFLKEAKLADVELTREDVLFLITTQVGDMLRRPVLHSCFAQRLDAEVVPKTEEAAKVKEALMPIFRGAAWSKFINDPAVREYVLSNHGGEDVFVNIAEAVESFRKSASGGGVDVRTHGVLADSERNMLLWSRQSADEWGDAAKGTGIVRKTSSLLDMYRASTADVVCQMMDVAKRFCQARKLASADVWGDKVKDSGYVFFCDNAHAFNQDMDVSAIYNWIERVYLYEDVKQPKPLLRPASLMVVEDNPLHQLFFSHAKEVQGLSTYRPQNTEGVPDPRLRAMESEGFYTSAERAVEVIAEKAGGGQAPPDLLMTDIELAGKQTGIDLIREVHKCWPNTVICMLYSSNVNLYAKDIAALQREGLIITSWHKDRFDLSMMVDAVNERFSAGKG